MKQLLFLTGALWLASCNCSKPVGPPDGGDADAGTPCTLDTECAFGEACVDGFCSVPVTPDAGQSCARHEDCPQGQLCLPSTGQCFTPQQQDAGDEDAGVIPGICNPGDTQSCGTSKLGECRLGTQSCQVINGVYDFGPCSGNVEPVAETCNAKDDDCDGLVDDGFPDLSCGTGECRRTVPACVNGQQNTCVSGSPSPEVCDNKDNDCDAFVDNMPDLVCGVGACQRTATACTAGIAGTCTSGNPGTETCNGLDDNCDGQTDEGLATVSCGRGICANTVYPCADGGVVACVPGPDAGVETCGNGLDDTCDGRTDEGCACTPAAVQNCYSGPNGTAGVGACRMGTQTCLSNGQWDPTCAGEVTPAIETCNNQDDDCDFQTDEMGSTSCGLGVCRRTVQNCIAGVPQTCVQGDAGVETCNALDDDCDGVADNNIANLTCGIGACFRSVPACLTDGGFNACASGTPTPETCNGVDDNCNSIIDDVAVASCSTGQPGPCSAGTTTCNGGIAGCQRTYTPVPELCNDGIDNDCNGTVDIAPACCNPNINRDSDPANECNDCNDNDGTIYPGAFERCNGKDDDCDALIDEGYDRDNDGFTVCGTLDGGGIDVRYIDCKDDAGFVFPLKTVDCGNAATPTTANGVDDNCNGYVDETCACNINTDRDGDGSNECVDCNDRDNTVSPGRPEVCDGKDNDCNRATTDNCGVSEPCGYRSGPSYVPFPAGTDQCRPDLVCVTSVATGALTCGSYCNQTVGLGLNDSCTTNQACDRILIDSTKQNLCSEYPAWTGITAIGGTCAADTDCAQHHCLTDGTVKYCTDNCSHESACPGTTSCYVSNILTVDNPGNFPDYYAYLAQCRRDAQIPGTGAQGQTCTADANCRSGVCFQGRCAEPCCTHSDCTGGTSCGLGPTQFIGYTSGGVRLMSAVNVCWNTVGARPSGAACANNSDCRSRMCDALQGICVDPCCNDTTCSTPGQTCEPLPLTIPDGGIVDVMRGCVFSPVPARIQMRPVP